VLNPNLDLEAATIYEQIRSMNDDVPKIARNTGFPERILSAVRTHIFLKEHQIAVAPNEIVQTRFQPDASIARLWKAATENSLSPEDLNELERLLAHEYVEQALMAEGLPYRSPASAAWQNYDGDWINIPTPDCYGAHDIAPLTAPERLPFAHWKRLRFSTENLPLSTDSNLLPLSELDNLVNSIKELLP
jgi:hypothetical protein